jgi:hypothetical protein
MWTYNAAWQKQAEKNVQKLSCPPALTKMLKSRWIREMRTGF